MFDITVSTVLGSIQRSILRLESCQSLKRNKVYILLINKLLLF